MAAGPTDEMIDNVKECILEYHLCSRRLIESLLCVLPAALDTQDSIRIPHLFERNGLAENADEFRRIGRAQEAARPVGECSVEMEIAVRLQGKDLTERSVESIGPAITIAVGGCAHITTLAAQNGPATLSRTDDCIEDAERVENVVIAVQLPHLAGGTEVKRNSADIAATV